MTEAKTFEELEARYPGLRFEKDEDDNARGVRIFYDLWEISWAWQRKSVSERKLVAKAERVLALLRTALTSAGEDLEEGEGDG